MVGGMTSLAPAPTLRVASYNIRKAIGTDRRRNPERILAVLREVDADIVALQEVKDYSVFTSWVTNYLGAGWSHTVSSSGCDAKTAFVYKTALVSLVSVNELSAAPFNTGDWDGCLRRPLAAVFKATATNRIFRLVNVHLKSGSDSTSCSTRQPQVANLNDYLNSTSTLPTILLGDMNDEVKPGVGICSSIDTLNSLKTNGALSILTKSPLIVSVGEDKRVCVWTWSEEGITLAKSLDIGRSLYRLAWSFTGQFCYVATQDTPLVLALDKDRENLIEV